LKSHLAADIITRFPVPHNFENPIEDNQHTKSKGIPEAASALYSLAAEVCG